MDMWWCSLLFASIFCILDWCHTFWWSLLVLTLPCCFTSLHFSTIPIWCRILISPYNSYCPADRFHYVCWIVLWWFLCPKCHSGKSLRPWERSSRRFQWTRKSRSLATRSWRGTKLMSTQHCIFIYGNTAFLATCIGCFDLFWHAGNIRRKKHPWWTPYFMGSSSNRILGNMESLLMWIVRQVDMIWMVCSC